MTEAPDKNSAFRGFVFLNISNPFVAWETYRGVLISATSNPPENTFPTSPMFANLIWYRNNIRIKNEIIIDNIRFKHYPNEISRLLGMYFFRDYESANRATTWVGHFIPENLTEVEVFPENKSVTKVDADWITFAKRDSNGALIFPYVDSFKKYWAGEAYSSNPHWEYIINGRAKILKDNLSKKALETIKTFAPNSLLLLEYSRIAALLGYDYGRIVPWIGKSEKGNYRLAYIINMVDKDNPALRKALNNYLKTIDTTYIDSLDPKTSLKSPNLTSLFTEFTVRENIDKDYNFFRIHQP